MYRDFSAENSALQWCLYQLRSVELQQNRSQFRENLRRVGRFLAYEISKTLTYQALSVQTPLGQSPCCVLAAKPVIGTVLRAGLPMHEGFLDVFDDADNAFVAAYRQEGKGSAISVALEYVGAPRLDGRTLIFCDPMLATATSMLKSLEAVERHGKPTKVHAACVIASTAGVEAFRKARPDVHLWVAAVDPSLNDKAYIVPGLGDAGDLAFGEKL